MHPQDGRVVSNFIVRKVDAIVLCPCDSKSVGSSIAEANKAGIPVFTADIACLAEGPKVVCHIASDNLGGGRQAAKAVANSPLFKCAVHGCDPNWGRIVMALGKSAAKVDPARLQVKIGPTTVFARGEGKKFSAAKVSKYLAGDFVEVTCRLGLGKCSYRVLTCDLSRRYVAINADYHT